MSRNEIGNYLGLAVETVSRVFTRFQQNELIAAEGKEVHILDPIQLCALAGGSSTADRRTRDVTLAAASTGQAAGIMVSLCPQDSRRWLSTPSTSNP